MLPAAPAAAPRARSSASRPRSPSPPHRASSRRGLPDAGPPPTHSLPAPPNGHAHLTSCDVQTINNIRFNVGNRYRVCDVIGEGAYGIVCSAIHRATGQKVAIKKIQPFEHQMFALRTLRELKLLRYFQECDVSENIISILDIVKPASYDVFQEVYLIQELMETDLHRVIRTQKLSDDHGESC
jgi:mitogen-activated protein kinase 1/3